MKSGNLNFQQTSGPLQACNGTALSLSLIKLKYIIITEFKTSLYFSLLANINITSPSSDSKAIQAIKVNKERHSQLPKLEKSWHL